ncbi:MAG: arylsulfatase [Caulobacteraceae bacterium]|nr:arylsulfatase [Caulobacteraceae bacterium]
MTSGNSERDGFQGVIGRSVQESQPWWPPSPIRPGAPNVVIVVLDDSGFSHFGCYGSAIETPNIDRLAAKGLKYTGFHTTALCSPTRACLLTGRNHHAVGMRAVSNFDTGFPNMRGAIPKSAATLPEILREQGYATFAAGKWHLAPMAECTAAGPFANWPLQRGFDRFYGFLQGETDQFHPELTYDNHHIDPPYTPEEGYHVSEDITDHAAGFVRDLVSLVPERPFFLYLAVGATHSPHQAPQAWLDKYRGRFDDGWDIERARWFEKQKALGVVPPDTQLSARNPGVKAWDELSTNEKKFAARLQEAFAAMLDHTDHQIGRLIAELERLGKWDNTLFLVMSDNGASQEGGATGVMDEMKWFNGIPENVDQAVARLDDIGGPASHSNIPWGWAQVGNTPLRWYKQNTHGGGIRDPLVVHWPGKLASPGETRTQFCHAIDVAPTILDAIGLAAPQTVGGVPQTPLHGTSFAASFQSPEARPDRGAQYFEMGGHRGLYLDGWKAVTRHTSGTPFDDDVWELYNLDADFSETNDLAKQEPERLKAMVERWWQEAETHGVLPLDDRPGAALFRASMRQGLPSSRRRFVYRPPITHVVADACPPVARGWRTVITLDHPEGSGDGALVARGNINSGYVIYVGDGRLQFDFNAFHDHTHLTADQPLTPGPHEVELSVTRDEAGGADITLSVDGAQVAAGRLPRMLYMLSSTGMDLGRSPAPVCHGYAAPFAYPGVIDTVVFEVGGAPMGGEVRAQARAESARQ